MIELDHLFVIARDHERGAELTVEDTSSRVAAKLAEALCAAGFCEGPSNTHPGQGTANRRFFFDGFMLEFLYVNDSSELRSQLTSALRLSNRFESPDASLFGVGSRSAGSMDSDAMYDHVSYKPDYLPGALQIQVAKGVDHCEPLWFHLPFARKPVQVDKVHGALSASSVHDNGATRLTGIALESPRVMSESSRAIAQALGIQYKVGSRQCVYLTFDQKRQGRCVDTLQSYGLHIEH